MKGYITIINYILDHTQSKNKNRIRKEMDEVKHSFFTKWGGLLEELESMEGFEELLRSREDLRIYKAKLLALEQSKTVKDARKIVASFTAHDRNYLNSPLLDHLSETNKRHSWIKWACRKGYLDVIHFLTARGVRLFPDELMQTACAYGQNEVIKFLLNKDPKIESEHLNSACFYGHANTVKLLIENGANVSEDDNSALCHACINGHVDVVKVIIESDPDSYHDYNTAFQIACSKGHLEVVKLMIATGADIWRHDNAIHKACGKGHLEVLKELMQVENIDIIGRQILFAQGHLEIVKWLHEMNRL